MRENGAVKRGKGKETIKERGGEDRKEEERGNEEEQVLEKKGEERRKGE